MVMNAVGDFLIGGSLLLIAFGGVYMNVMLLIKIKKRAEANPNEKMNKLFISLALTHLCLCFFLIPLSSSSSLTRSWLWGEAGCTYYGFMGMFLGQSMIVTMLMICLDLYFETIFKDYDSFRDKVVYTMLAVNWAQAIFWGVGPLMGWSTYGKEPTQLSCTIVASASAPSRYISYIFSAGWGGIWIPIIGSAFTFILIGMLITEINEYNLELAKFNSQKILQLTILLIIEWGPYTAYYFWPIIFGYEPLFLNAISPVLCKSSTILTTFVLWNVVDNKKEKKDIEDKSRSSSMY